ncbi:hypothetical protein HMPREF1554_02144, partial [Porphyromonas gingivalis F0569]
GHFYDHATIRGVRTIHNARINDSTLINTADAVLLELLIQLPKEFIHNPQAGEFATETTDRAMIGGGEPNVQTKEFTEKQGVVDAFFNLVVTQTIPSL